MKENTKGISNEQIIAAMLQCGTITAAAKSLDTTPRTIYSRMKEPAFREQYDFAKQEVLRSAVSKLNGKLSEAIDTISEIMTTKDNPPSVRLQAAQAIIKQATDFTRWVKMEETATISRANWAKVDPFFAE